MELSWFDVVTLPPERNGLILAFADGRPMVLGWSKYYRAWIDPVNARKFRPSHWLEIPDYPKTGA